MTISTFNLTVDQLTEELNTGKEIFVKAMLREGVITKEQTEIMNSYAIVLAKKGFFGSLWDKIFKKDDSPYYFIVKIIRDLPKDEEDSEGQTDE